MTRLLVIKEGEDYFRFKEEGPIICKMAKASVYPESQAIQVQELLEKLQDEGHPDAEIRLLTIIEEKYQP